MLLRELLSEAWSEKYKRSINCASPKGFSQRAHCQGRNKEEDYHPNDTPPGPETKPTMPAGTVRVDVDDVYDWYKLGQHISNMKGLGKHDFGKGPPSTIFAFGSEEEEHKYINALKKTGLTTTDIDPVDPKQPKGMPQQKVDPTFNVGEGKKKKRKPRRAAYGPGPYGWYGYYPGYSGDSGAGEGGGGEAEESIKREFAPAGFGGNMPPRGPKNKGREPWDNGDSGNDPYSRPEPEYYSRSIDFFGQFEADHFDKEDFDKKTGVFKGYWEYDGELKQIAYFKFDDPKQAAREFDDSPGMGWYYEPQNEGISNHAPFNLNNPEYQKMRADWEAKKKKQQIQPPIQDVKNKQTTPNFKPVPTTKPTAENFADGRNPQDKGDAKRHGINTKASISSLRKTAKQGGRKGQLAHWLANMKSGRKKANESREAGFDFKIFEDFFPIAMKVLGITKLPRIKLVMQVNDQEQPTFGRFDNGNVTIELGMANRHPIDILRTLAHELVHFKQLLNNQLGPNSGETGSPEENEAHELAGVIMRHFNKMHRHYFHSRPLEP